ncbi:MAG TPA: citrate lyase acyl carrier protein [Acholeplasma sp.]|jgi:citrate lyase subunit gamma (acyl carrier protein)|nr:citrate lyase acyl carrier protein [Acholeplasma sp.]
MDNIAVAGTLESNDCLITVKKIKGRKIVIDSIVFEQFGKEIEKTIIKVLDDANINDIFVNIVDKGALDYTIIARLKTALKRLGEEIA